MFEAVKNFTILAAFPNATVPSTVVFPLFCEFDPDLVVVSDYQLSVDVVSTAADAICTVVCPQLNQFDQGRLFNFSVGGVGLGTANSRDVRLEKKIACSGQKINGNYTFSFVKAADFSVPAAAHFTISFTLSFRRYARKPLGIKGAKPMAPDSAAFYV